MPPGDERRIETVLTEIGTLQSEFRGVHLHAHIELARTLSPEQVRRYDQLRGYTSP